MINITPCLILIEILMIYWDNDTFTVIYCQTIYQKKMLETHSQQQDKKLSKMLSRLSSAGVSLFNPFTTYRHMPSNLVHGKRRPVLNGKRG